MKYDPARHRRHSIRLKGYDYSQSGLYFLTLCTYQRQWLFGEIHDGQMTLNQIGKIVAQEWRRSPEIRPDFGLDAWVIMPDHLHGVVVIENDGDILDVGRDGDKLGASVAGRSPGVAYRKPRSLSSFVAGFKSSVTKRIKPLCDDPNPWVWQRNYYEAIVRNERHLNNIRQYIFNNPQKWQNDVNQSNKISQNILINFQF